MRSSCGALTTYADVMRSEALQAECPLVCRAAAETGGVATQNRGTIGGNIANASPAADTPPALLVYDADVDLASMRGVAARPVRSLSSRLQAHGSRAGRDRAVDPPGARPRRLAADVAEGRHAPSAGHLEVCLAAAIDVTGGAVHDIRIALGSVAPTVVRAAHAEAAIRGRPLTEETIAVSCEALARDIAPIDDLRSTAAYRLRVARNLLEQFLTSAVG